MQFTEKNKSKLFISGSFVVAAVVLTIILRFVSIADRPFHNDEAVNSIKFKHLLEKGEYIYDPIEYHGPTLYYFTLIGTWIFGEDEFSNLSEYNLRGVNVFSSVLLLLGLFWIRKYISTRSTIFITLILIVSPFINFYSRYYIHESLFASFSFLFFCSIFLYFIKQNKITSLYVGIFAGLVFATKETSLIIFFGVLIAIITTELKKKISLSHLIIAFISFIVISFLFYSSFFENYKGVTDSVKTFSNYISKSSQNEEHIYPWYYYLKILNFSSLKEVVITEVVISLFALVGIYYSFRKSKRNNENYFFKVLSIISILFFIILSLIPYKTPWNIFTGWMGLTFLSGYGMGSLFDNLKSKRFKVILGIIFSIVFIHLIYQTYITSYRYHDAAENPFTYSQPTKDIYRLTNKIDKLLDYDNDIYIAVVAEDDQYWPLPWYLRKSNNVSWSTSPRQDIYMFDMIIADTAQFNKITEIIFSNQSPGKMDLYVPFLENDAEIRPRKPVGAYIKYSLITSFYQSLNE